jgi:tellurite resistance protein
MNPTEAQASVRILLAVARADSSVADDERRTIGAIAAQSGARFEEAGAIDVDAELARLTSPDARRLTMRAALAIALVDGKCTPEERRLLEQLNAALGGALEIGGEVEAWTARMAELRSAVEEATDGFLHAVTRASKGAQLSSRDYEALVAGLEKKKKELLAGALG